MNELMSKETITSRELLKQINIFRAQEERSELRHDTLKGIIRDEFEEEINIQEILDIEYKDSRGRKQCEYVLTLSQAKQVLVRESKFVRKAVIRYIEELEEQVKKMTPLLTEREKAILMVMNAKGEMEKTNALAYLEAAVTKPLLDTIEELEEKLRQQKLGVDGIYTGDDVIQFLKNEKLINSMCTVTWLNEYLATLGYMSKGSYFYEPTYKFKKELADEGYAYTRTTGGGNQKVLYRVDFIHLLISEHLEDLQTFMDVKVKTFSTKREDEAKAKREQRRIKKEQEEKEKMEKKQNKKVIAKSLTEPKVLVFKNANQTEKYGFTRNAVYRCLRGERKSHKGYTWEFLNKVEE